MRSFLLLLAAVVFASATALADISQVPDRCNDLCDNLIKGYKPNMCMACIMDLQVPAYCQLMFERNAVPAADGVCDPYHTKQPTLQPTPGPTKKPTEYYFPTMSPQSKGDYDLYFDDKHTRAPTFKGQTHAPAFPPPSNSQGDGDSSSTGLAAGLGAGIGIVAVLFVLLCCCYRYRRSAFPATSAGGATEFGSGATNTMLPTESPQKQRPAHGGPSHDGSRDDEVALT